jgi:hypothetical protein
MLKRRLPNASGLASDVGISTASRRGVEGSPGQILALDWLWIGFGLALDWLWIGFGLALIGFNWL